MSIDARLKRLERAAAAKAAAKDSESDPAHVNHGVSPEALRAFILDIRRAGISGDGAAGIPQEGRPPVFLDDLQHAAFLGDCRRAGIEVREDAVEQTDSVSDRSSCR